MALIGLRMFVGAVRKSENNTYKLFVAPARLLWGDHVHSFFSVGVIVMGISSLLFVGV